MNRTWFRIDKLPKLKVPFANSAWGDPVPQRPNIAKIKIKTNLDTGEVEITALAGFKNECAIAAKYGDRVQELYEKCDHYMVYSHFSSISHGVYLRRLDWYVTVGDFYPKAQFEKILTEMKACGIEFSACIKANKKRVAEECAKIVQGDSNTETSTIEI